MNQVNVPQPNLTGQSDDSPVVLSKTARRFRKYGPKAKTSFRNNIVPPLAGILVMVAILAAINGQWITAQFKYRFAEPVASASTTADIAKDSKGAPLIDNTSSPHPELGPQLTIPSIKVVAPVQFNQGNAEWQIQLGLRKGVVHYDTSVNPGQTGNVVIFGHSSGQPWAPGDYKFIFTLLDKVSPNDLIYLDYQGTRYTYQAVRSEVVAPTDVSILKSGNDHELTLITCTPVGTSKNRLIVRAIQISPAPNSAASSKAASTTDIGNAASTAPKQAASTAATPSELPGNASGSFWDSIRNLFK